MHLAIISATTFPASEPGDITATQGYGSESSNATLAHGLADLGHHIEFFAPVGSSRNIHPNIRYHPIRNSHGDHIDEMLDICALDGSKYTDLLNMDFIISGEKLCHNIEQLTFHSPTFKKYCCYRSGYADFIYPAALPVERRHYVTHCKYFQDEFKKAGHDADVCFFGIPEFWMKEFGEYWTWFEAKYNLSEDGYWLFPHRPSPDKGIGVVLRLAEYFPNEVFVISTASPLPDHKAVMKACKRTVAEKALNNVKFVDIPETPYYQYHRRALISGAKAVLCPFPPPPSPYLDTGGLVGAESMRCGTPLLVTRSPGSEEWWGAQDEKGVVFVDGMDSARMVIKNWSTYSLHPECPYSVENYAKDYMKVVGKYTS